MLRQIEFRAYICSGSNDRVGPRSDSLHPMMCDVPDQCPQCGYQISPVILPSCCIIPGGSNEALYVAVLWCPHCLKPFIAYYKPSATKPILVAPRSLPSREFDPEISTLSPSFVEIYNQALAAETMDLRDIAGMGYRKALEFLLKDYLVMRFPGEKKKICSEFLSRSIERLDSEKLRLTASRAAWLGNDFTHYTRKYEDYDIDDLKKYIRAALHWIMVDLTTDEAASMDRR